MTGKPGQIISGFHLQKSQNQNEAASQCVEKIAEYVSETYDYVPTEDEKLYLLVHVLRTVEQKKTSQKGDCYGKD